VNLPDRSRRRLLQGGAIGSVLVLLLAGVALYVKGGQGPLLEILIVTAAVILVAVLVGAAIAVETSRPPGPPPPPPPLRSDDE
jgi:uncharacterized membrane protein